MNPNLFATREHQLAKLQEFSFTESPTNPSRFARMQQLQSYPRIIFLSALSSLVITIVINVLGLSSDGPTWSDGDFRSLPALAAKILVTFVSVFAILTLNRVAVSKSNAIAETETAANEDKAN